eukprot:5903628-Pleurochrysis_carterae.AAC.1
MWSGEAEISRRRCSVPEAGVSRSKSGGDALTRAGDATDMAKQRDSSEVEQSISAKVNGVEGLPVARTALRRCARSRGRRSGYDAWHQSGGGGGSGGRGGGIRGTGCTTGRSTGHRRAFMVSFRATPVHVPARTVKDGERLVPRELTKRGGARHEEVVRHVRAHAAVSRVAGTFMSITRVVSRVVSRLFSPLFSRVSSRSAFGANRRLRAPHAFTARLDQERVAIRRHV